MITVQIYLKGWCFRTFVVFLTSILHASIFKREALNLGSSVFRIQLWFRSIVVSFVFYRPFVAPKWNGLEEMIWWTQSTEKSKNWAPLKLPDTEQETVGLDEDKLKKESHSTFGDSVCLSFSMHVVTLLAGLVLKTLRREIPFPT